MTWYLLLVVLLSSATVVYALRRRIRGASSRRWVGSNKMSGKLQQLISQKEWERIVREFSHDDLARILPFKGAMFLARDLFFENFDDSPSICHFAINLFFAIRRYHRSEWDEDWKNDLFLSGVCQFGYKYDESYFCCMRAYKRIKDPPPALLLELAGCIYVPSPRISEDQAEGLVKEAFQKEPSYEAALMLRGIYVSRGDEVQGKYWSGITEDLEQKNIRAKPCDPDVFQKNPSSDIL
jgi:hypothetical protein